MQIETDSLENLENALENAKKMRASWEKALMHAPSIEMGENIRAQIAATDVAIEFAENLKAYIASKDDATEAMSNDGR